MFPDIPWFAEVRCCQDFDLHPVTETRLSAKWECAAPPEGIRAGATVWGAARVLKETRGRATVTFPRHEGPRVWFPRAIATDCGLDVSRRLHRVEAKAVVVGPIFPCTDLDPFLVPAVRDCDLTALGGLADTLQERDDPFGAFLAALVRADSRDGRVSTDTVAHLTKHFAGVRYGA